MLICALNRNLGLTLSSDIIIERFKSMNWFFTISKGFVSSESEFVEVHFFVSVSSSSGPNIVISAELLSRKLEFSNSKAWHGWIPIFLAAQFFASVSSFWLKIVIWDWLLARTTKLSYSKAWNVFFTISKGFVRWEAKFVEVQFFASVSCSSWPKIVIWA